jgi:hypothetical protein
MAGLFLCPTMEFPFLPQSIFRSERFAIRSCVNRATVSQLQQAQKKTSNKQMHRPIEWSALTQKLVDSAN